MHLLAFTSFLTWSVPSFALHPQEPKESGLEETVTESLRPSSAPSTGLEEKEKDLQLGGSVVQVASSTDPKNRLIATVSKDGYVSFFRWNGTNPYPAIHHPHLRRVAFRVAPKEQGLDNPRHILLVGAESAVMKDISSSSQKLKRYNPEPVEPPVRFQRPMVEVLGNLSPGAVAISPGLASMAVVNETEGAVLIYNLDGKRKKDGRPMGPLERIETEKRPRSVTYQPEKWRRDQRDGQRLAVGKSDGTVELWQLDPLGIGKGSRRSALLEGHAGEVSSVAFNREGNRLASADVHGQIRIWDLENNSHWELRHPEEEDSISALAFSLDGKLLASAGSKGAVYFWKMDPVQQIGFLPGEIGVLSLAFSQDGKQIAIGKIDNHLLIKNVPAAGLEEGEREPLLQEMVEQGKVSLQFTPPSSRRTLSAEESAVLRSKIVLLSFDLETAPALFKNRSQLGIADLFVVVTNMHDAWGQLVKGVTPDRLIGIVSDKIKPGDYQGINSRYPMTYFFEADIDKKGWEMDLLRFVWDRVVPPGRQVILIRDKSELVSILLKHYGVPEPAIQELIETSAGAEETLNIMD